MNIRYPLRGSLSNTYPEPHTYTIETTHSNQQKNGAAEGFTGALPVVAVISNTIHNQHTDYQHNDI